MIYLQLFISMFQIGLFSIGGGYVAIPLLQHQIVDVRGWISMAEFADIITISEMTPGPIAINASTFVGIRVGGIPGALISTLGCIMPSCVIVLILAKIYYKYRSVSAIQRVLSGLRPAVVGMIASAALGIIILAFFMDGKLSFAPGNIRFISIAVFAAGIFALRKLKAGPIGVIGCAGLTGLISYIITGGSAV